MTAKCVHVCVQVEECAMIASKEAKDLLYQLFWHNLVKMTVSVCVCVRCVLVW